MNKGLILADEKRLARRKSNNNKIDKALKVAIVVVKKVLKFLKVALIIAGIYYINFFSEKITKFIMELDFQTIKTCIFSILTIFILFNYLKVCEEVKGVE